FENSSSRSPNFLGGKGGETIRIFSSEGSNGGYAEYQDLISENSEAVNSRQRLRRNTQRLTREGTYKKKEGRKGYLHMNTGLSLSLREWRRRGIYWFDKDSDEGTALGIELVCLGTARQENRNRLLARDIRIPAYFPEQGPKS
ncbi:hypothetical protein K0M31_008020, partial [Melipona bicolor]